MSAGTAEAKVIDIDLRERYEDLLSFGSFTEVQRAFAASLGLREGDLTRVLVIDDTRDLEAHAKAFDRIVKAPGVQQVICLAVGPSLDEAGRGMRRLLSGGAADTLRVALRKPFELASHATLWVGDARGVGWSMGRHQSQVIATGSSPARGPVLDALVDALLTPRVFDRVYEAVRSMPDGVASPGLRAMIGQVDDDVLADARVRAIDRILAPHRPGDEHRPAGDLVIEPFKLLLRYPRVAAAGNPILAAGGEMAAAVGECRGLVTEAESALAVITSPAAVQQKLWGERGGGGYGRYSQYSQAGQLTAGVRQVGARLTWLSEEMARLFDKHDSLHPLGTTAQDELHGRGFALTQPDGMQRVDQLASLRHLVEGALASRRPVAEITGWLNWMHETLVPTGSAARLDEVASACPADRLTFLREMPRRLVVSLTSMLALLPVLVCAVLAAAAPAAGGLGTLAGIIAAGFVAARGWPLVVARRVTPLAGHRMSDLVFLAMVALILAAGAFGLLAVGEREPDPFVPAAFGLGTLALAGLLGWWLMLGRQVSQGEQSPIDLAGLVVTAVAGAHLGLVAGTADPLDPVLIPPVQIAAGVLALLGLMWWPHLVWSRAVRAWRPAEYVQLARGICEAAVGLLEDVARYDWSLTGPRRVGADLVRAMSLAFEDITSTLGVYSDRLRGFPARPPRGREPGVDTDVALRLRTLGTAISKVVEADVVDLIASVVERCWPDIEKDALDALGDRVTVETRYGLDRYDRHLARMGVHAPPPFRTGVDDRQEIVDAAWQESERLGALLRAPVTDGGLMQLCAPEHLQSLDVDPRSAVAVRFAPRAARTSLVARGPDQAPVAGEPSGPLPPEVLAELEWPEWGQVAGVLRLVRLRAGAVETVLREGL